MRISRPDLAALAFGALIAVCMTVCALLHVAAPGVFPDLALIALSAGVGIAVSPAVAVTAAAKASPAAAPELPAAAALPPAAAVKIPDPAPALENGPAVATHAP